MSWYDLRPLYGHATCGDLLPFARLWAADEIDVLKGRHTLAAEVEKNRIDFGVLIGRIPLVRAKDAYLAGRRADGLSQAYVDRLDKLFTRFVSADISHLPMATISSEMLLSILASSSLSPGNLRVLRPFLKDLFGRYREMHWGRNVADVAARSLEPAGNGDWPTTVAALPTWTESQFEEVFTWLLSQEAYWQQALCLRLFLCVYNVPMTTAMAARWDQFYIVEINRSPFGRTQKEKRPSWYWSGKQWRAHVFRRREMTLVDELRRRAAPGADVLFPSRFGRGAAHIRSVEHVWRETLARFKLPYASPRQFRSHYHALNLAEGWWHKDVFGDE